MLDDVLAVLSHEYGADTLDLKARQKQLNEDKNRIQAEVLALKPLARLEDLSIFKVRKWLERINSSFTGLQLGR